MLPSSTTMVPSGRVAPTAAAKRLGRERTGGTVGPARGCRHARVSRRSHRLGQSLQRRGGILPGTGQRVHGAAGGDEVARLAGVGEEGHRRLGVDQDEVPDTVELGLGHLGQVGQPVHCRDARPALEVGGEGLAQERGARSSLRPGSRRAGRRPAARSPPRSNAARSPPRRALATSSIVSAGTTVARPRGRGGQGPVLDSDQDASAGRTRVATHPGGPSAAATASAASAATSSARAVERYQPETGPAMEAMSDCSGAS